jgi:gliding motility-associated-like protein
MRTVALFLCFTVIWIDSLAQTPWLSVVNGPGLVDAVSISIDPEDNVLAIGNFENGVNLEGTAYEGAGSYLIKLSKDGTILWHRIVRYGAGQVWGLRKVDSDGSGNVYIAGNFSQFMTVGGVNLSSIQYSGVVAKFNPQGEIQWTKVIGNVQEFYDLKVNASGQVLLYSMQTSSVTIDGSSFATGANSFGVMLNSQGTLLWAKALGSLLIYTTWPRACAIDDSGNAYFHGIFSGTLTLDGHRVTSTGGNHNFFITKVNSQGTCQWITRVERNVPSINETTNPPNNLLVERGALEVDADGNIYLGGYSWTGIKVGTLSLPEEGTCIIKFNGTGQPLWVKLGDATSARGTIVSIALDGELVYVAGTRPLGVYFSVYTADGIYTRSGGVPQFPASNPGGLRVDSEHQVYLCGRIAYGTARFQGFVLKYGTPTPLPGSAGIVTGPTSLCPSDNLISFTTSPIDNATSYQWEINEGGALLIVETYAPELHFKLSDYQIDHDFSIRVRGKSLIGTGIYSTLQIVNVHQPATPILVLICGEISIEDPAGVTTLDWYFNNTLAEEYGRTSTSITPAEEGVYHVTIDDQCGPVDSNRLVFAEEEAPTLLVDCGKISVENSETVTTVDWYFNDTLAEEYGRLNTSITPTEEGTYYAAVDDGCGPVMSTEVAFVAEEPKATPAIVASCTEISIVEPAAGITVDWYFNNARVEKYGRSSTSIKPEYEGTYHVAIDDVCGPIPSNEVSFEFLHAADFELPNVITPNGDDFNQQFAVDTRLESPALVIFNRWGKEVYANEKYTNTWEGDNLPSGVYYYQLNSKCLSTAIKGILTIAR